MRSLYKLQKHIVRVLLRNGVGPFLRLVGWLVGSLVGWCLFLENPNGIFQEKEKERKRLLQSSN